MVMTEGHTNNLLYICTEMRRNATLKSGANADDVPEVVGTRYGHVALL